MVIRQYENNETLDTLGTVRYKLPCLSLIVETKSVMEDIVSPHVICYTLNSSIPTSSPICILLSIRSLRVRRSEHVRVVEFSDWWVKERMASDLSRRALWF